MRETDLQCNYQKKFIFSSDLIVLVYFHNFWENQIQEIFRLELCSYFYLYKINL